MSEVYTEICGVTLIIWSELQLAIATIREEESQKDRHVTDMWKEYGRKVIAERINTVERTLCVLRKRWKEGKENDNGVDVGRKTRRDTRRKG
jgi:hypothetical protein